MNDSLELKLIECLMALEAGEPIDQILTRYPADAAHLRSMLETASRLSQLNVQPSLAAQVRSRDAFLAQAAAMQQSKSRRPSTWIGLRRILMPVASLVMILLLFGASLVPISANALPGDALYDVKLLLENTRMAFTTDPSGQAALRELYHQRRIQEIEMLLAENREADVFFDGVIEAIQADAWIIAGLNVQITGETIISGGDPVIGQLAMVNGRTQNGTFTATAIQLSMTTETPDPTPTNTPPPVPTATDTAVPSATDTETPTETTTATPTIEPSPTATVTPTKTPALQPTPTATHVPDDDNDNDNGDDGDNNNDNDDDNDNDDGDNDNGNDNDDGDDDDNHNDNDDDNENENENENHNSS